MLKHVPFYGSLLKQPLTSDKKSTYTHVLLYGAIEVHAMGPKGCIASNNRLAADIGVSKSRVDDLLVEIHRAGWVAISTKANGERDQITPNGEIKFSFVKGSSIQEGGVPASRNIGNSESTLLRKESDKSDQAEGTIYKLFWDIVRKYKLPVTNANHIRKWADDIEAMDDGRAYLNLLLVSDLRTAEGSEFRPRLNTPFDIIQKKLMVQRFYNGGDDAKKADPRSYQ